MPPDMVNVRLVVETTTRSWLSVTAPENVVVIDWVIVAVPLLPLGTEMGLANGPATPPFRTTLAVPLVSPSVMIPAAPPNADALVVPLTVPDLMVRPPVKVLAPAKVIDDDVLF